MNKLNIPKDLETNACEAIHNIGIVIGILEMLKEDLDKKEFDHKKNLEAAMEFLDEAMREIEPFEMCRNLNGSNLI